MVSPCCAANPPFLIRSLQARADANLREHPERGEANGALMRATPLGVWGHRLPPEAVAAAARADAALSHPAQACRDASALYSIALAHLVAAPGDAQGALAAAEAWADAHAGWLGWCFPCLCVCWDATESLRQWRERMHNAAHLSASAV